MDSPGADGRMGWMEATEVRGRFRPSPPITHHPSLHRGGMGYMGVLEPLGKVKYLDLCCVGWRDALGWPWLHTGGEGRKPSAHILHDKSTAADGASPTPAAHAR